MSGFPQATRDAFKLVLDALDLFPAKHGVPDLLAVRPGYRYGEDDATKKITATPAVILAVAPRSYDAALPAAKTLEASLRVPVVVEDATLEEQAKALDARTRTIVAPAVPARSTLEDALRDRLPLSFAPRTKPPYKPPARTKLKRVKARMKAVFSVSPENGWPVLSEFLSNVQETLAISMYQFTAPHIVEAVTTAAKNITGDVTLTLHPVPEPPAKSGVKANEVPEADVIEGLDEAAKGRFGFQWAPVFADGLFATAYHIKVAVADRKTFWLSSGNWQSSNQPGPDVLGHKPPGFQTKYNRDYHAVIENDELAEIFGNFLAFDFEMANQIGHTPPGSWQGPNVVLPADFVAEPFGGKQAPKYFAKLVIDRELDIQPLLTPDNYAARVLEVIQSAKTSIRFQNQYINLSANAADNYAEFNALVKTLIEQQQSGVDVKVICRDMMDSDKLHVLVARGLDPDTIRFQSAMHNKCIIVDDQVVVFGSHNWSNDGAVTNRDASLIVYDEEVAKYFAQVWDYDWEALANKAPAKPRRTKRVAEDDEDGAPDGSVDG